MRFYFYVNADGFRSLCQACATALKAIQNWRQYAKTAAQNGSKSISAITKLMESLKK
jgi:hypothetical protein